MAYGQAPPGGGESQGPRPVTGEAEHPEAHGFGSRQRWRKELMLGLVLLVALPFIAVWAARWLAESVALRLPPSMDARLGRPTWEALELGGQRCKDDSAQRYVQELVEPLLIALGETPFEFRFMLSKSEEVNAFALPGGYVVVNLGLLRNAESGDEIAAVLAHEISHVTSRHATQRLAGSLGARAALALVLGFVDLGAPAYTVAHLAGLQYERRQESEADEQGRALLARAGLSPLGMATFFERLSAAPRPPEIISTHPDPGDRAEKARRDASMFKARLTLPDPPEVSCE
jgi:predicted Zn-dependent protease